MTRAESNRVNARRSTGPKSPAGKAVVAKNAVRHGAYSEALTMLLENPEDFAALHAGLVADLHPEGPMEKNLVDRMASLWWRMERTKTAANQSLWTRAKWNTLETPVSFGKADDIMHLENDECRLGGAWDREKQERLLRHELTLEKSFFRSLHELERLQARRNGQAVPPPLAFDVNLTGTGD